MNKNILVKYISIFVLYIIFSGVDFICQTKYAYVVSTAL